MRIGLEPLFPRKGSLLEEVQKRLAENIERLSSMLRINRAKDDAAGLAISESLRGQIVETIQGIRNLQDRISRIQVADQALGSQSGIIDRMRELAVQATNATLSEEDRTAIEREFSQLREEINRIAEKTTFNEQPVIGDMTAERLGLSNVRLGDETTLRTLDRAKEVITSRRANLGAEERSLASEIGRLGVAAINLTAAESLIRDNDVAEEVSSLTINQILEELNIIMLNQARRNSSNILNLLREG
ncbi:MAG: flagellin [Synergistetes bacterium]|nr:flagellin [Synergistota bacterium]MDW8192364.1 flagellin [Synergistota bacterium]